MMLNNSTKPNKISWSNSP